MPIPVPIERPLPPPLRYLSTLLISDLDPPSGLVELGVVSWFLVRIISTALSLPRCCVSRLLSRLLLIRSAMSTNSGDAGDDETDGAFIFGDRAGGILFDGGFGRTVTFGFAGTSRPSHTLAPAPAPAPAPPPAPPPAPAPAARRGGGARATLPRVTFGTPNRLSAPPVRDNVNPRRP
jgi:hypothetical protein